MPSAHESTAFCRLGLMWSCLAQDSCQSDGLWFLQSKEQSARERQAPVSLRSSPVDHSPVELASATQHERIGFRRRSDAACKQFGKNCVRIYEIWVMQMFWQRAKKLPAAGGAVWRSCLVAAARQFPGAGFFRATGCQIPFRGPCSQPHPLQGVSHVSIK